MSVRSFSWPLNVRALVVVRLFLRFACFIGLRSRARHCTYERVVVLFIQETTTTLRAHTERLERSVAQQQNKISEDTMNLDELREKKALVVAERQLLLDQIESIRQDRDRHSNAAEALVRACLRACVPARRVHLSFVIRWIDRCGMLFLSL